MAQLYLYLNSLLFFFVAVRTTLAPRSTATGLGYLALSDRGRVEYLVVYGGFQLGLALLFFLLARNPAYLRLGLLISAGFYAPILLVPNRCRPAEWAGNQCGLGHHRVGSVAPSGRFLALLLLWVVRKPR